MSDIQIQLKLARQDFALDVNLTLPAQGITVLYGASGSGKTTVLRCVAGLKKPHRLGYRLVILFGKTTPTVFSYPHGAGLWVMFFKSPVSLTT